MSRGLIRLEVLAFLIMQKLTFKWSFYFLPMYFYWCKIYRMELLYWLKHSLLTFHNSTQGRKKWQNVYFSFTLHSGKRRDCESTRAIIVVTRTDLPSLGDNLVNSLLVLCSFSVPLSLFILRHFPLAPLSPRLWLDDVSLSSDSVWLQPPCSQT